MLICSQYPSKYYCKPHAGIARRGCLRAPFRGCLNQQCHGGRLSKVHGRQVAIVVKAESEKTSDPTPEGKGNQREQPANRSDGEFTWTKLRVERQTHLPASREEAWSALQQLLPDNEWKTTSAVFSSLEAIYRAELQQTGEELLSAFAQANAALEYIPPVTVTGVTVRSAKAKVQDTLPGLKPSAEADHSGLREQPAKVYAPDGEETENAAVGSSSDASPRKDALDTERNADESDTADSLSKSRQDSNKHASTSGPASASAGNGSKGAKSSISQNGSTSSSRTGGGKGNNGSDQNGDGTSHEGSHNKDEDTQKERVKQAISVASSKMQRITEQDDAGSASKAAIQDIVQEGQTKAGELAEEAQAAIRERVVKDHRTSQDEDTSAGGGKALMTETASSGRMLLTDRAEPSEDAIIVPTSSVDITDVSRMDLDLKRQAQVEQRSKADPHAADKHFVQLLVKLLQKAHYAEFTGRDAAMSKSLNSDYLAQLYIKADTKSMDKELAKPGLASSGLPDEAKALVVYKRGYGQARRRGRMISAKVDFLQLLVVKATVGRLAVGVSSTWAKVNKQYHRLIDALPKKKPTGEASGDAKPSGKPSPLHQARKALATAADKIQTNAPQLTIAGGGLFMTLNNWGLVPESDVLPLEQFNRVWQPDEPERLEPVHVERVSIRDALGGLAGLKRGGLQSLWSKVELIEPTFQDLLVLYRQIPPSAGQLVKLKQRILGPNKDESTPKYQQRNNIMIRIYRDIPVPSWKVVFPNKLLQFRPLDGLRSDLVSIAGLLSYLIQLRYDSFILEVITTGAVLAFVFRAILGYRRLNQRYERAANEMLAKSTIAGQEGVITYLANAAALQQFEQTALAYVLMSEAGRAMGASSLAAAAESLLEGRFQVRVRFNAEEAISELLRLQLIAKSEDQDSDNIEHYSAVSPAEASDHLTVHWKEMLQQRIDGRIQYVE